MHVGVIAAAAAAVVGAMSVDAWACGGCFSPPPMVSGGGGSTTIQTVTDHRMVLSVSATQTTLWDQFSYSGNPEEFAWILPIRSGPETRVELASDRFMDLVDQSGRLTVEAPRAPTRRCGQCVPASGFAQCLSRNGGGLPGAPPSDSSLRSDASSSYDSGGGVTVIREEVVGPYQVVTLRGSDAGSLRAWLTSNSFAIPASIEPTLMHYINLSMDFIAVRLRGGEGLRRMAPIRVRMPGSQAALPLRMVSAGISDKVGLLLTVISSSRMEAQNFANFALESSDLVWDFATMSDAVAQYRAVVFERTRSLGAAWQTETARTEDVASARFRYDAPIAPPSTPDGGVEDAGMTAPPQSDITVALTGLAGSVVFTRMRAELSGPQLDRDLLLRAATGGDLPTQVRFGVLRNTQTPAACAPLNCGATDGRFETDGTIYGVYGERVAPSTVFPAEYRVGSLPDHVPVERTVPPVQCPGGGSPIGMTPGSPAGPIVRCSVETPGVARFGAFAVMFAALSAVVALRRRRSA